MILAHMLYHPIIASIWFQRGLKMPMVRVLTDERGFCKYEG